MRLSKTILSLILSVFLSQTYMPVQTQALI